MPPVCSGSPFQALIAHVAVELDLPILISPCWRIANRRISLSGPEGGWTWKTSPRSSCAPGRRGNQRTSVVIVDDVARVGPDGVAVGTLDARDLAGMRRACFRASPRSGLIGVVSLTREVCEMHARQQFQSLACGGGLVDGFGEGVDIVGGGI